MPFRARRSRFVTIIVAGMCLAATCGLTAQAATPGAAPAPDAIPGLRAAGAPAKSGELAAAQPASQKHALHRLSPSVAAPLDRSGKKRVGKASFYAPVFAGKKMADGTKMNPHNDNAASRTLPLGTTAKVTNLETGKSAFVTIQDRGPYVGGRIVDLSPATAREIGLSHRKGVTRVEVSPLAVPLRNGGVRLGAAGQAVLARNDRVLRQFPPVGW
jgi:rare lipoprotein A